MFYLFQTLIYLIIFFMGAVMFTFLSEVIVKLPNKENIAGKSVCRLCGHERTMGDDLPVVSLLHFHGRCRYCNEKKPTRELLLPYFGGLLAVLTTYLYGVTFENLLNFLVFCDLAVITFIDIDTQEIPPVLNLLLLIFGVISFFLVPDGPGILERVIGLFCISVPMFLILLLCNGFGGGDVKMMFAAGFLLGWKGITAAFVIGALLGGIYGVYLLASKKLGRKGQFAFGPFLSVGVFISLLNGTGTMMADWYINYVKSFFR